MRRALLGSVAGLLLATSGAAQTPAGGDFLVNVYTTQSQDYPHVAMEPDGDFLVVWGSPPQAGAAGRRFAANGTPRGGEFLIDTSITLGGVWPAAAVGPKGDFVVVWRSFQGGLYSFRGRLHDRDGAPVGADFLISTPTTVPAWFVVEVGRAADGSFVVTWGGVPDGNRTGIAARRFTAWGTPIGAEFLVNAYTFGDQISPSLAVEADGDFLIVWNDRLSGDHDGSLYGIFGQRFAASGARLGGEFVVNSYTTGAQGDPSISASPSGGFVVEFGSEGFDGSLSGIAARRLDAGGSPIGNDFLVNTYTTNHQAPWVGSHVAHDERGNFVIIWRGNDAGGQYNGSQYGVFGQRFSAAGARRGGEFRVNAYTTGGQLQPSIASDAVGNFVVAWTDRAGSGIAPNVKARRFGGLAPAALVVDTPGNGVLEPGENVDVRPVWRNTNGAAQTFSGALSEITGPPGATYAITDATAAYGTVPDGSIAPCTDCFAVSVSNPPARPAVHWDATALESILPDTQGQQKLWRLHLGGSFADVGATNPFYRFVETLLHHGVTAGCGAGAYCAAAPTTRVQMAVFVLVAREGPTFSPRECVTPMFADLPETDPFCRWVEELARRGVVGGCGANFYCPGLPVTREQMAVFVLRTQDPAFTPPPCTAPPFGDVPISSGFCPWIAELARRGIVTGCGGGNYCPVAPVTRAEMAVFIGATFALQLYGP